MLTERWFWCDRTLGASVRSTLVRFQRAVFVTGRVRSVLTGHKSESGHNLNGSVAGELTGAPDHLDRSVRYPAVAHNGSF